MTTTTFFFIFIPLLAFILLAVNLIFAPHNPYQEKDSVFECGFHSFLGQNRTQFSISFFIFALLFLLFDLEILLVYPYIVSAYTNSTHGLIIMLIFFSVLTIGFVFELGKKALKIDSRQVFSLPKVQVTTTRTALSGFFSKDSFAIFRGLFKIKHLKLALKKVFAVYTVFIMLLAFTITTMIRIYIINHQPQFLIIESDFLFYISSISTIFTATSIRKYFQLFNPFFESIEWHSVYDFFTCSKTERSKVLQDFIKSLEQFNNEKIKLNNFEHSDSSKENVSSRKPFNIHDINNTVSQMKKAPSNSLIKASGSGNNDASSSGASGSGNNNAIASRASGSVNNNTDFTVPRPDNNWPANNALNSRIRPGTYLIENNTASRLQGAAAIQNWQDSKLKHLYDLNRSFADKTYNPFQIISRSPSPFSGSIKTLSSEGEQDITTNWQWDDKYSDNWNTGLTKLARINNIIFLQINAGGGITHEVETVKHIINKMYEEMGVPKGESLLSRVGDTLSERTMSAVLIRYPIYQIEIGSVPVEPDLYTFILHIYNTIFTIYQMVSSDAEVFTKDMITLAKRYPYKISQYKTYRADEYKIVAGLVDKYGTEELKTIFANENKDINSILISLGNYGLDLFMAAKQYGTVLDIFINKNKPIFVEHNVFETGADLNMQQYYTAAVVLGKARFSLIDKWSS